MNYLIFEDTFRCWLNTRANNVSASLGCEGEVSLILLELMDKMAGDMLGKGWQEKLRKQ